MTMRIWHQSTTELDLLPGYAAMLAEHAERVTEPGVEVVLHGVDPGTYAQGVAPIDTAGFPLILALVDQQIIRNCVLAQEQGYDAVAISCFRDPGVELARSLVDIPVISMCQSSLFVADTMGKRFALMGLDRHMETLLGDLVSDYGFDRRVATITSPDKPLTEFELDGAFADPLLLVERIEQDLRRLVSTGVDVIIPSEGVLNVLLVRAGLQHVGGVPVLDSWGSLLRYTMMLVELQRRTGLVVGRTGDYASPPLETVRRLQQMGSDGWVG